MSHCIRCGHELPSAGAECPDCRIAFQDVVEDSSFLDDEDDDEEEFEPAPRANRISRWDKYLDESPVFAGQEDAPPTREPFLRDRRPAGSGPQPVSPSEPQPVDEPELVPMPEAAPEPVVEFTVQPVAETPVEAPPESPIASTAESAEEPPTATETLGPPLPEVVPVCAPESVAASESESESEPVPMPEPESAADSDGASLLPVDHDEVVTAEVELTPVAHAPDAADDASEKLEDEPVTAPVAAAPASEPVVLEPEPEPEPEEHHPTLLESEHTESITAPVDVVVVLPVEEDESDQEEEADVEAEAEAETPNFAAPWRRADADAEEGEDADEPALAVVEPGAEANQWANDEPAAPQVAESEPPVVQPIVAPVVQPVAVPTLSPIAQVVEPPPAVDVHTGPANVKIAPRFEFHSAPAEGSPVVHAMLDLEPTGAPLVAGTDGPLAHVVLALDLSASMNDPRKYPVLTRAIEKMLADLRASQDGDVLISLVVFAYGAEILLRAQPASELDARDVLGLIDRSPLRFSRYTDIVGALTRAGRIAYDSHRAMPRVPVRIYLLTDGKPQDIEGAHKQMALIRKIPVDVHGLGFGNDADLDVLQALISGGRGGTVKHVRSDTLSSAFERIAQVARRVVAKRALLDIELKGGVVGGASYRFRPARHSYGKRAFEGGQHFRTDLGTLESGRRYSLLFQLRLPPTEQDETEIGRVTLRIPGEGGPVIFEHLLYITRHCGDAMPEPDGIVVEARHVVEAVGADDPRAQLQALRARRRLYMEERRDPYIIELIDRAIEQMETKGSLDALSNGERAALQSHTQSVVGTGA